MIESSYPEMHSCKKAFGMNAHNLLYVDEKLIGDDSGYLGE
ncbi:hypothetical protein [Marinicellulosiphila megalodicopiae]